MIFVLGIIALASAVPLWIDYRKNPSDNLLVRSGTDAARDVQNQVNKIELNSALARTEEFGDLPAWLRTLIKWGLQLVLHLLRLLIPTARD